jgi:hypothetical protein
MLISETHFTDRSYFSIPKYTLYFTNHPDHSAHGGTAILIKSAITHYELPQYQLNHIQATVLKVKLTHYELAVAAVYCPPKHIIKKDDFQDFFQTLGQKFIAGGDYNSKNTLWGSRLTTTRGRELTKTLQENKYTHKSAGTPTYWPTDSNKIPDLLDFFVVNGISSTYIDVEPSYDLSSDHTPIIATVRSCATYKTPRLQLHNKKTNWAAYRTKLHQDIKLNVRLKSPTEIDNALTSFISIIKQATQEATPLIHFQKNTRNVPIEIRKLIAEKRRARARWQRSHAPMDKTAYNHTSNRLKWKLKEVRDESFTEYITSLNRYDNSIWKPIKHLKQPTAQNHPIRHETSPQPVWARSDEEKTTLFAEYFATVFTPHDDRTNQDIEGHLLGNTRTIPGIKFYTVKEVYKEIASLKSRKAPGIDGVTPTMLKEMPRKGLVFLTYIFNAIIKQHYWPKQLKLADIILIPKPGKNPTSVASYRPISLLPIIAKLLERLLLKRIRNDPRTEEWIPSHQFGFRANHSPVQQIHRLTHTIYHAFDNKEYCTSTFLDASQAFDKVWHPGLLYKIKKYLPDTYYSILKSYLHDREFRIRINDSTSPNYAIKSGVPQGSVLGPLLYLLYTADLPVNDNTTMGTFADDIGILSTSTDPALAALNLQNHLNDIQEWTNTWKIKINETKSVQVNFSLRREQCPPVTFNNIQIPQSSSTKYLGVHLDDHLTWKEHITKKRKQIDLKTKEMQWLIGRNSKLSLDNKLLLYHTIIKPIWEYGVEIWGCASDTNISTLQRSQSRILRMITNAPWYVTNSTLHADLQVPLVKDVITKRSKRYYSKMAGHENTLLQPLLEPHPGRRLKRKWPDDLKDGE